MLMVLYHFVCDLQAFAGVAINHNAPPWFYIGKTAALLFIFVSGLANGFSRFPVRRGCIVLFWGMVITIVTYLFLPEEYVRFGILHFLGLTMILYPLLNKLSSGMLGVLAVFSIGLGLWFTKQIVATNLLLPLGLRYAGFSTIDYYPLFPYVAVTLFGILAYRRLYAKRLKTIEINWKPINWLSRNSLKIYILHQPLLLLILLGIGRLIR